MTTTFSIFHYITDELYICSLSIDLQQKIAVVQRFRWLFSCSSKPLD